MPYGVVMASAGAGRAAALAGWHGAATALTVIAVGQAVLVPTRRMAAQRGIPVMQWRFGLFTVALGLAVISANLQALAPAAGNIVLCLAWLVTAALTCWRLALAGLRGERRETVDGTWFLAPAALLGAASATVTALGSAPEWVVRLAVAVCLAGVAEYILVIAVSGYRIGRRGLGDSPLASWWIAAGCGGLAAAALGHVAQALPAIDMQQVLNTLVTAMWVVATLLLAAILTGCLWHALRRPPGPWTHVWTPVFSTAVYAAGTNRLAMLSGSGWLETFAFMCIIATLALWIINSGLYLFSVPAQAT